MSKFYYDVEKVKDIQSKINSLQSDLDHAKSKLNANIFALSTQNRPLLSALGSKKDGVKACINSMRNDMKNIDVLKERIGLLNSTLEDITTLVTECEDDVEKNLNYVDVDVDSILASAPHRAVLKLLHNQNGRDVINNFKKIDPNSLTKEQREILEKYYKELKKEIVIINGSMPEQSIYIRDYYNTVYELLYPQEASSLNTFLKSAPDYLKNDIENIKYIAYNSPEPYHTIFFNYINKCKVSDWNCSGTMYYGSEEKGVYINFNEEADNPRGAYASFFHEIGHNIDDLAIKDTGEDAVYLTDILNNGKLEDMVREDVHQNFDKTLKKYNESSIIKIDDSEKERIKNVLLGKENEDSLDSHLKSVYRQIHSRYTNLFFYGADEAAASDAYGGVTNNRTTGNFGHNKDGYWYNDDGSSTQKIAKELFAEYFAMSMTKDKDMAKTYNYLPKSYEFLNKTFQDKANQLKSGSSVEV